MQVNGNSLGDASLACFASVVNQCPKLKSVSFENNLFCDITLLTTTLVSNSVMDTLSFKRNAAITDATVVSFLTTTLSSSNSSLKRTDFERTGASGATLTLVQSKLAVNARSRAMVALCSARIARLRFGSLIGKMFPAELYRLICEMM
jgi:hypothetical protein